MDSKRFVYSTVILSAAIGQVVGNASAADAPTPAQALTLTPIQPLVEYATPTKEEMAQCTIRAEKENNVTAWVVRNRQGEILRRFADTNNDNVVDMWCYYLAGLEVYRDIDSNFNGKADQYRWLNTAGTRWGIDKNEDRQIDSWKTISPHEVAEQVVFALKTRDPARFQLLLLTPSELSAAGFGKSRADRIADTIKAAPAAFSKLAADQNTVTQPTRFVDFGSARPAVIPAGSEGATKDVIVCDNASALVQTDAKHDQLFLGTLVAVDNTWKMIQAPTIGSENQPEAMVIAQGTAGTSNTGGTAPNEEMQKLMAELERLDKSAESLGPDELAANIEQRTATLRKLADATPESDRDQWYRQLADVLSVAIQSGNYPKGVEQLEQLQKDLAANGGNDDLASHAAFQSMWAQYIVSQRDPNANAAQLQTKWLADLQAFVGQYPKSSDTAEALYQLGMYQEFIGKSDEAAKWYQQLVTNFPKALPAEKAGGALRRLNSQGKPMALRGNEIQGGTVDLAQYRGKIVLIHYWATLGARWKEDLVVLKDLYAKKAGREFDIIGVCLDENPTEAKQYLTQNKFPWKQIYERGGLDSRLANEMGVMTLPLMILVDQKGNVANQNVHVEELDTELAKLKPETGAANASRGGTTAR
jgi:tetratricopeptide (TPR) repeat protein